jgi:hypothetical protein
MNLEPKHKNLKDKYKLKRESKKLLYQVPHVYINGFRMTILPGISKLCPQRLYNFFQEKEEQTG